MANGSERLQYFWCFNACLTLWACFWIQISLNTPNRRDPLYQWLYSAWDPINAAIVSRTMVGLRSQRSYVQIKDILMSTLWAWYFELRPWVFTFYNAVRKSSVKFNQIPRAGLVQVLQTEAILPACLLYWDYSTRSGWGPLGLDTQLKGNWTRYNLVAGSI